MTLDGLRWPALDQLGVDALVTGRAGGVSEGPFASLNLGLHVGDDPVAVVENRRRAAAALGATLDDLVLADQVHGTAVAVATAADRGRGARFPQNTLAAADVLVTTTPGVVLAILVADCVPILLVEPEARVLACVHAGWRGTVAGVARAALDAMVRLGADPARVNAFLGPAVPPERYEVGPEVAAAARHAFGDRADRVLVRSERPDRWRFDLWTANALALEASGVPAEQVSWAGALPTGDGRFFSDRAERPCGRFGLLARLQP